MPEHTHTCATPTCRHTWPCLADPSKKVCPVDTAAKVNKQGPFCDLCLSLEMAKRYADARAIRLHIPWPPPTPPPPIDNRDVAPKVVTRVIVTSGQAWWVDHTLAVSHLRKGQLIYQCAVGEVRETSREEAR